MALHVIAVMWYALYRAHLDTLRRIKVSDAFGAQLWVDDIDFRSFRNGAIRALGFANIAVNAFVGNDQRHKEFLSLSGVCQSAR